MKRPRLLLLASIGGLALASSTGCGGRQSLTSPTGLGGGAGHAAGKGASGAGASTASGPADGGERPALDGGQTAGTETLCVSDGGIVGRPDGATADVSDAGACAMVPADPPTFAWAIPAQIGSGGGCQATRVSGQIVDVVCSGDAWLRARLDTDGGTGLPTVSWSDGTTLAWQAGGVDPSIPPPIAPGAPDRNVWAELQSHGWLAVPGQCGWAWDQSLTVRDSAGGKILFMARQGASLSEPTSDELAALFGVGAHAVTSCTHDVLGGPALFHQSLNEHVLETTPPQAIPYGVPTQVTTPNGSFAVLWYARTQVAHPLSTTCAGCLNQGPIVGFVASPL